MAVLSPTVGLQDVIIGDHNGLRMSPYSMEEQKYGGTWEA